MSSASILSHQLLCNAGVVLKLTSVQEFLKVNAIKAYHLDDDRDCHVIWKTGFVMSGASLHLMFNVLRLSLE